MTEESRIPGLPQRITPADGVCADNCNVQIRTEADPLVLAKSFVRVGRRGARWDLPRRFASYKAADHTELSVAGAAPKFILRSVHEPGDWYIVKSADKWGVVETLTELLNNRLGVALGFPMAHAGLIRVDGTMCFASRNFQRPGETLIHGSLLFLRTFNDNLEGVGKKIWDEQRTYDIELIGDMLTQICGEVGLELYERFLEMLVFDALIGSMDRHMQNWGVLATVNEPRTYRFAPFFDSARALLWNVNESKLEVLFEQREAFDAYIDRARPIMGCASIGAPVNHFDLIKHLLERHPRPVLGALERIFPEKVRKSAQVVREFPFDRDFSRLRAAMILKVLERRAEKLHQIASERR